MTSDSQWAAKLCAERGNLLSFQFGQKSWNLGTVCGNSARTDLWGKRWATGASTRKYNYSLKECFDLIRIECSNPIEDSRKLLNLILFNGLIGNADGHAKNISLLHDENGTTLAPFYDLVSTMVYPQFTKKMPMKIAGKKRQFGHLQKHHFDSLSEEIGMKPNILIKAALNLANRIITVTEITATEFKAQYGSIEMVDKINSVISFHARSLIDTLSEYPVHK